MKVLLLHHVSLPVRDLSRSQAFYQDLFGFPERAHPPFRKPGAWLAISETAELHLNEEPAAEFRTGQVINTLERHFALTVEDFAAALAALTSRGYDQHAADGDPKRLVVTRAAAGFDRLYLLDPDFNVVEVNSPLRAPV